MNNHPRAANLFRSLCVLIRLFVRFADARLLATRLLCLAFVVVALDINAAQRPRLAVLTDIGGDPDDQQSLIRLMVYANEFDIELLLASAAGAPSTCTG